MEIKKYQQMMNWLTRPRYAGGGRTGFKTGGQIIIEAYDKIKARTGKNPSIEQVRVGTGGKPNLKYVRKTLTDVGRVLSEPRGGLKKSILKSYQTLKKKLGRNPTSFEIDEMTSSFAKSLDPNQRKSVITEYLKEAGFEISPSVKVRTPESRVKAAETLKAKERPRLGQLRKTDADRLAYHQAKTKEDIKRDRTRIKRKIRDAQKGTGIDIQHMYPKTEYESLRRLMPLASSVNRAAVRSLENKRDTIKKLNLTPEQENLLMKKYRRDLRKVPGGKGSVAFPIKDEAGNLVKWIGKNDKKSYAGIDKGKFADMDFNIEDPKIKDKIVKEALKKKGPGMLSKIFGGSFGPTGIVGLTAGLGVDLESGLDRASLGAEAALAPTLVKGTEIATKGIKNQTLKAGVERLLNAGMRLPMALKVARVLSPIGLASLAAEGLYQSGKKEMARREQMSSEELEDFHLERQSRGWSRMKQADGGITALNPRRPGALPPKSGPQPYGLPYVPYRVKKTTEY